VAGAPIKAMSAMADSLFLLRGAPKPRISLRGKFCETMRGQETKKRVKAGKAVRNLIHERQIYQEEKR
jgi:hypothetical protein